MSMLIKFRDPATQQYRELKLELASIGSRQIRVKSKLCPVLYNNNFGQQIGLAVPLTVIWLNTKMAQKSFGLENRKRKIDGWQWQQIRQTRLSMDSQMTETIFDETIRGKIYLFKFTLRDNAGKVLLLWDDDKDAWKNCCKIYVKSDFSKNELDRLHLKAIDHVKSIVESNKLQQLKYLHRTKNEEYWQKIFTNPEGPTMRPVPKDGGGHAASPINDGQIDGIYFSARMKLNGELHEKSPYGTIRLLLHPAYLLDPDKYNLYFADFYCYSKAWATHRISLVVVPKESPKNEFCAQKLIQIDIFNNPFIRVRRHLNECGVYEWICDAIAAEKLWVEIIFTKDLLLNRFQYRFEQVECTSSFGEAKPGGLQNNIHCQICNIYPVQNAPSESMPFAAQAMNENGELAAMEQFVNTAVFNQNSNPAEEGTSVQQFAQTRKAIALRLSKPTNIPPPQIPCQNVKDQQNIQNFHPQILPGPSNSFEPKNPDEKANKCPPTDGTTKKP